MFQTHEGEFTCPLTPPARASNTSTYGVSDPDRTATLITPLCGWRERWRGPSALGGWTIHLGSDGEYIALCQADDPLPSPFAKGLALNHIALVVDDLDAAERILIDARLEPLSRGNEEPGRRFYVFDWDGIEWELVSYA